MEKLVSRSLMLILIGMATAQNIQAGERMSMPTSFKKQTTGLSHVSQQTISVKGNVRDQSGEPMAGVNVIVEGTTIGTMTDSNGNFTLNVPSTSIKIKFSYIGYEDQIVLIKNNRNLNITLNENSEMLDEVQIIGYGTQKKITVTGAVSSVGTKDILKSPVPNIAQALTGKVPGLSTIQYSGQPGADDPAIFVRGIGSLDAKRAAPLVMVDGVERSFFRLDPNEIENITVLKDASATAVFGVRGANGVILVTTKRGEEGKAQISVSTSASLQKPIRLYEYANSYDYAVAFNEKLTNDGASPVFGEKILDAFKNHTDPLLYPDMDWMELILKPTSFQSQHNLSISGGTDRVRYFTSVGILTQDGLFRSFDAGYNSNFTYNRYNYRANLDIDVTRSTLLKINLGGRLEDTKEPNTKSNLFTFLTRVTPFGGAGLYDGKWIHTSPDNIGWDKGALENADPFECFFGKGYNQRIYNEINLDLSLQQKLDFLTKGLSLNIKGSYNSGYTHRKNRYKEIPYYTAHRDPETNELFFRKFREESQLYFEESTDRGRNWYLEGSLNYDRKFGKHQVGALILYNQWRDQYPDPAQFDYVSIPRGYVGLVGRATYNFDNRYLLGASFREDGSSRFGLNNQYGFFPSFSAAWRVSNENFFENAKKVIDDMKVRLSYGTVGNAEIGDYASMARYENKRLPFGKDMTTIVTLKSMANPDLRWEKSRQLDAGIDLSFFNGRIEFMADYYHKITTDLLYELQLPSNSGYEKTMTNLGKIRNQGLEMSLNTRNIQSRDFLWTTSWNYTMNRSMVLDINDNIIGKWGGRIEEGHPLNALYGYVRLGTWGTDEAEEAAKYNKKPGDIKYWDKNGNGMKDGEDQDYIGNGAPKFEMNMTNTFSWKGFTFMFDLQWVYGNKLINFTRQLMGNRVTFSNAYADIPVNAWTPENQNTMVPSLRLPGDGYENDVDSWSCEPGSFLRLRNIGLKYDFSSRMLSAAHIKSLSLGFNVENAFLITNYSGSDPEVTSYDAVFEQGVDFYTYPKPRTYSFTLGVNF